METIVTKDECTHLFCTEIHSLHKLNSNLNQVRNPEKGHPSHTHRPPSRSSVSYSHLLEVLFSEGFKILDAIWISGCSRPSRPQENGLVSSVRA